MPFAGGRDDREVYAQMAGILSHYGDVFPEQAGDVEVSARGENRPPTLIWLEETKRLRSCDLVVAEVSVPSFGVGYLLAKAEALDKPALALYRSTGPVSSMLVGNDRIESRSYRSLVELRDEIDAFIAIHG